MIVNAILKRIRGTGTGSMWTPKDFLDLGTRAAVDQGLSRLTRRGTLVRVARGLYHYPRRSPRLGLLAPRADVLARAISRRLGTRVIPSGAMAANLLGLSLQVPAKPVFLTDGRSRLVRTPTQTIRLRRVAPSRLRWGPVVHALAHLGPSGITDDMVKRLRTRIASGDRHRLVGDTAVAPDWMRPVLAQLTADSSDG
jgi:hypothetical protein